MIELRPEFSVSSQIWSILLGFWLFCLDLAIQFGYGLQRRHSSENGAQGYGQTDRWTDSPCVLKEFVPFGATSQKPVAQGQYVVSDTRHPALQDCG